MFNRIFSSPHTLNLAMWRDRSILAILLRVPERTLCRIIFIVDFVGCRRENCSILKIPIVVFDRWKWRHMQITTTISSSSNNNEKILRFNAANYFRCCIFRTLLFDHTALILFIFFYYRFFRVCESRIYFIFFWHIIISDAGVAAAAVLSPSLPSLVDAIILYQILPIKYHLKPESLDIDIRNWMLPKGNNDNDNDDHQNDRQ